MTVDIHSHIIPAELLNNKEFGIGFERGNDGSGKIRAWGLSVGPVEYNMFEPELQIRDMNEERISKKVLSIPPFLFAYNKELSWAKNWSWCYNDALSEVCNANPERFLWFATVPLQHTGAAVDEMRRCLKKKGLLGIEIGTNINGLDLDNEHFSEFFEEADSIGCSILVHPNNILATPRFSNYYMRNLVGNPVETTIVTARLILSGFSNRYPNIRVCFSHGGGAFPYILGRIRHGMKVRPEIADTEERYSLFSGIFFDCIVHDAKTLKFLVDTCGIETVLLGSDYPFDMGITHPVRFIEESVKEKEQRLILEENPKRFLRVTNG